MEKGQKNSHRTEQFSNDTIKSHFSRGDSALCHFQMLSYCGPHSVLSCHPPADVSLHSLVCKHFAFSRNLFKQYFWSSKNCLISFSVLCVFLSARKSKELWFLSLLAYMPPSSLCLFICQLSLGFTAKLTERLHFLRLQSLISFQNAYLKPLELLFHWGSTWNSKKLLLKQKLREIIQEYSLMLLSASHSCFRRFSHLHEKEFLFSQFD